MKALAYLAQARKAVAALTGAAAVAISADLLHGQSEKWTTGGLAIMTAFLTYYVPANAVGAPLNTPTVDEPGPLLDAV